MLFDRWVVAIFAPLALWILLNGLDDLLVDIAWAMRWIRRDRQAMPGDKELEAVPERRMAIFVPLWKEHRVIQNMVEHNTATQKYKNYDFFIGAYPNDPPTLAAVNEVVKRFSNAHLAVCPHGGPTSKADCLNWIYQRMLVYEEENGVHFDMVLTHDAEDLVHPEALRWINYYAQWNDMVQIPVLALPTPFRELTHGVYCDEFAEFQFRDMPARQFMGGFIPSNGVGTGFSRTAIEKLALRNANRIFEPRCLTEDYENGFRLRMMNCPQVFVPIHRHSGSFIATREYFPREFKKAVRQRTRWVTGIALQSWELHGLADTLPQLYWFWRDRRSVVGNLIAPLSHLIFLYGALTWIAAALSSLPWGLAAVAGRHQWLLPVCVFTLSLQFFHMCLRACCSAQVYGWKFATGVPLRMLLANWINFLATASAVARFGSAKIRRRPLVWLKTEHNYPNRTALFEQRRKLGEILVGSGYLEAAVLEGALAGQPAGMRIGEWLVRQGKLSVEHLYEALALQANVPLGRPSVEEISIPTTRTLPARVCRALKMLPFRVVAGHLYIAGVELPDNEQTAQIRQYCALDIRLHLVTPTEFDELASVYLPRPPAKAIATNA